MSATAQALAAVNAAKHARQWGDFPTRRYLEKHGVTVRLWQAARDFETRRKSKPARGSNERAARR